MNNIRIDTEYAESCCCWCWWARVLCKYTFIHIHSSMIQNVIHLVLRNSYSTHMEFIEHLLLPIAVVVIIVIVVDWFLLMRDLFVCSLSPTPFRWLCVFVSVFSLSLSSPPSSLSCGSRVYARQPNQPTKKKSYEKT